jgi:hypothetical protein
MVSVLRSPTASAVALPPHGIDGERSHAGSRGCSESGSPKGEDKRSAFGLRPTSTDPLLEAAHPCRLPIGEYRGADYDQAHRYRSGTDLNSGRPPTRMTCEAAARPIIRSECYYCRARNGQTDRGLKRSPGDRPGVRENTDDHRPFVAWRRETKVFWRSVPSLYPEIRHMGDAGGTQWHKKVYE